MADELNGTPEADDEPDTRRMDDELRSISAILRMLSKMDELARRRVVTYLAARFPEE